MKRNNPFTLMFGLEPYSFIERNNQIKMVEESFLSERPMSYMHLISGVRGSGKTVLLTSISNVFKTKKDWIVVELNPELDLLESLASQIYEKSHMKFHFVKKEFSFSFQGLSFAINGDKPVSSISTLLDEMLNILKKQNKKVLVCIDEVSSSNNVKAFCQQFQILIRNKYPIFLLMTGLFENIRNLREQKTLTFLYRCPVIEIGALDLKLISESFEKELKIDKNAAIELAKITKGYAFAYQALGHICFEYDNPGKNILYEKFDRILKEFVYDKIWLDLPDREKDIVKVLAKLEVGNVSEILSQVKMTKETFSPYRERLIKKGILEATKWGVLDFALPRFKEFVLDTLIFSY